MKGKRILWIASVLGLALLLTASALVVNWLGGMLPVSAQTTKATPAQSTADGATLPRTITVVGEGTIKVTPDIARTTIGVETTGATVRAATSASGEIMQAVYTALKAQGIAEKDIQTSGYSVWTERNNGPDGSGPEKVTYRVTSTVMVTIRDLDKVGATLDAAIEAGANSIYGIEFNLADTESISAEARKEAVADALAKAQELARLNGVQVGDVVSISEVIGTGSTPLYGRTAVEAAAGLGGGTGPFNPGEMEFSLQLQIVYAIK